jgi:hypothetical protein
MTSPGPVRFSHLRAYGRSGVHGYQARFSPEAQATYAMQRGTAVHALLFDTRKVLGYHGATRRGKEYDAFVEANPETEILTMTEYDKARGMVEALRASEVAKPYLQGVTEQTILFRWMGEDCRSTPDVRGADFVTELKTCPVSEPTRFNWHALKMSYHAQMRFEAIAAGVKQCYLVAVEVTPPYPVTTFKLTDRALEQGEKLLMLWMERLRGCEQSQQWMPYCSSVVDLDVPEDAVELTYGDEE